MTVKLVMLKSGEDIIADVKEIKSNDVVIGYYFDHPLIIKMYEPKEPTLITEDGSNKAFSSKFHVRFFPWIPLSEDKEIPCSADWVITIVEPLEKLKLQYQEKLKNGKNNKNSTAVK
tara:strand:+ start:215 stop:565 length:351 start_codon:yes stop_codon:yes gene_type:complete